MKRAILPLVAVLGLFSYASYFALLGCASSKHTATLAKDAVITCAKADSGKLLALSGELAAAALTTALSAGKVDWDALVSKAVAAGKEVGGCAFAALYRALDKEPETVSRSLVARPDGRRDALVKLRAQLGGTRWDVGGAVL